MSKIFQLNHNDNNVFKYLERSEIKLINNFNNIGLNPHTDGIPEGDINRKNRIQCFIVTSNNKNSEYWSRTTAFIPESHKHINLFHTYWIIYHPKYLKACKDGKKIIKGLLSTRNCPDCIRKTNQSCPQWLLKFNINDFNTELEKLYLYRPQLNLETVDSNIKRWWILLDENEKNSIITEKTPKLFKTIITNFNGGECILFMPGLIHWVMFPSKGEKLYTKIFLECYTDNISKIDDSGYTIDDGNFKQDARNFEKAKYFANKDNLDKIEVNINTNDFLEKLNEEDIDLVVKLLKKDGIVGFQFLNQDGNSNLQKDVCNYLSELLEFPNDCHLEKVNVMKAIVNKGLLAKDLKILDKHLYRHPDSSQIRKNLSSIFPSSSGNTGLGAYSNVLAKNKLFYNKIVEQLNPIFLEYYNKNVKLDCPVIGYQGCK